MSVPRMEIAEASRGGRKYEDIYVLLWYIGVNFTGQDNKTSVPVSRSVPIAATLHITVQDIVENKIEVESADHDWKCENIVLSVTGD